jgi:hypothetical protein
MISLRRIPIKYNESKFMNDELVERLNNIVNLIDKRHQNDPVVIELLDEMAELMMKNELETINFLEGQSIYHERIIRRINTYFDDIAIEFHSNSMAAAMTSLIDRYPNNEVLKYNVDIAIKIMENMEQED